MGPPRSCRIVLLRPGIIEASLTSAPTNPRLLAVDVKAKPVRRHLGLVDKLYAASDHDDNLPAHFHEQGWVGADLRESADLKGLQTSAYRV